MKFETVGEVFFNGRVVNLDKSSIEYIDSSLEEIKREKEKLTDKLNNILEEIQN